MGEPPKSVLADLPVLSIVISGQFWGAPIAFSNLRSIRFQAELPTDKVLTLLQSEAPRLWEVAEVLGNWIWINLYREATA